MTEHRDTRNPGDWKRGIAAGALVILAGLSLASSAAWTLLMYFATA